VAGSSQPSTQLRVVSTRHSGARGWGSFLVFGAWSMMFGPLLHACASLVASPAFSAPPGWFPPPRPGVFFFFFFFFLFCLFPCIYGFSFVFWVCSFSAYVGSLLGFGFVCCSLAGLFEVAGRFGGLLGGYSFRAGFSGLGVWWGFYCFLGFMWDLGVVDSGWFSSVCLWVSWVVPVYTTCVRRGAFGFFNKIFLLIKKKKITKAWWNLIPNAKQSPSVYTPYGQVLLKFFSLTHKFSASTLPMANFCFSTISSLLFLMDKWSYFFLFLKYKWNYL